MAERLRMLDGTGLPYFCNCFHSVDSINSRYFSKALTRNPKKKKHAVPANIPTIISPRVLRTITSWTQLRRCKAAPQAETYVTYAVTCLERGPCQGSAIKIWHRCVLSTIVQNQSVHQCGMHKNARSSH